MMADEDAVDHIPKTIPQCDKSHGCDQGDAGGVHDIVGTLPTFWWGGGGELNLPPILKGRLDQISVFRVGFLGRMG